MRVCVLTCYRGVLAGGVPGCGALFPAGGVAGVTGVARLTVSAGVAVIRARRLSVAALSARIVVESTGSWPVT